MEIIIATHNQGKFEELSTLLKTDSILFRSLKEFKIGDIDETGTNYIENAILKAKTVVMKTSLPAIADDSGLEIYALNGFPGLRSARCAGVGASDETRVDFILRKMNGVKDRRARFISTIAFIRPDFLKFPTFFISYCEGEILTESRGKASPGLPYDSIFYYPEYGRTLAEISKEEKHAVSHRGDAGCSMQKFLNIMVKR